MSRRTVVIRLEGVVQQIHGGRINPAGLMLWKMIGDYANVYIVTAQKREAASQWLKANVNLDPVGILGPEQPMIQHVNFLVGSGSVLEYVITSEPEEAKALILQGHRVLAYLEPSYQASEWRPNARPGPRPWDEVADEIITQRAERFADERTKIEVERAD